MAGAWPLPGEGSRLRPEGRGPGGPPGSETVRELSQASKTATTAEQRTQAELTTRTVSGKQWTNPGSTRACAGAGLGPVWGQSGRGRCRQQTSLPGREGGRAAKAVPPGHWFQLLPLFPPERHGLTFASQYPPVAPSDRGSLLFPNKPTLLEMDLTGQWLNVDTAQVF